MRLIAFAGVVLVHVGGIAFVHSGARWALVVAETGRFGIPIFVALTALLHSETIPKRARTAHVARRAKRLLLPYAIWTVVYLVIGTLIDGGYRYGLREILFFGAGYGFHLWFLMAIFLFETLAVFVTSFTARTLLVCALAVNALLRATGVWVNPIDALFSATSPWTDWLMLYFAVLLLSERATKSPGRMWLAVLAVLCTVPLSAGRQLVAPGDPAITLMVWSAVALMCVFAVFISRGWRTTFEPLLARSASLVLGMYIVHYLPIKAMMLLWTPPQSPVAGSVYSAIVAGITIASTAAVIYAWKLGVSKYAANGVAPVRSFGSLSGNSTRDHDDSISA